MTTIKQILLIGAVLFASLNLHAQTAIGSFNRIGTPIQTAPPDSIVAVTAEAQGLSLVAPEDLPLGGTFWEVMPSGIMAPLPCPPIDQTLPIYAITDTAFLVDATGGQVTVNTRQLKTMSLTQTATSDVVASALDTQATAIVDLINQVQTASANQQVRTMAMAMGVPSLGGDTGSSTNSYSPNGAQMSPPDYGTNFWIAQWQLTNHAVTGFVSNTIASVAYEIQTNTDLATTNWGSTGLFVYGSETTNWTALSLMSASLTNNCFFRLRSWASSDGSGLPDWWQLQYFGYIGVDPYGNPAGDGYSNLQKFQLGWNPNQVYTPPAPQNFTVSFDGTSSTATVNWSPSPGPVTGYTVSRVYYGDYDQSQTFNVSAGTSSVHDPLTLLPYTSDDPTIYAYYSIQANYPGGASASTGQWLEPFTFQQMPTISVVPAADGSALLAVAKLSAGTAGLRLTRIDLGAESLGDSSYNTNYFIPVSSLTNGIFQMPAAWANPPVDGYGSCFYEWYVQTVNANGGATCEGENLPDQYFLTPAIESLVPAFYDGRVQMKQNLIYQLRVASVSQLFNASPDTINNPGGGVVAATNYVVSSYNLSGNGWWNLNWQALPVDVLAPFKMNCFYRNFVFDPNALDASGKVTNGISSFYSYPTLLNPPVYQFQTPQNGTTSFAAMLGTEASQWLAANGVFNWGDPTDFGLSFDGDGKNCFIAATARNFYGLPFLSAKVTQDEWTELLSFDYLAVGGTLPVNVNSTVMYVYPETAQPQLQTVEYDFWSQSSLPGQPGFSPTNVSNPRSMVGVGSSIQIAGYAKLAVQNGYSGVYGYLGQYFDKAYKMTNGTATTNTTGILSPYGNFFATEPGPTALVTMPDIDTGERGTGTVYTVSVVIDRSQASNMDLSFNGANATSANNPAQIWCNNNFDRGHIVDGSDFEQDDLSQSQIANLNVPAEQKVPDCQYKTNGLPAIPCSRDLEDYFRLWLPGLAAAMAAAPTNYTVQLTLSGDGQIRVFRAYETSGGTNYLFDETTASNQVASSASLYVGLLTSSSPVILTNRTNEHYIFCGTHTGSAQVDLQILDGNQNVVVDAPAYLQINDIKNMYERWTVGDNAKVAPMNVATNADNDLPNSTPSRFQYTPPTDTTTPYILFVHGWNMEPWEKDRYAEAAYKRLYWQGYKGRFGIFQWPTGNGLNSTISVALDARNYDNSESNAWASATGLTNLLTKLDAEYPGKVYLMAHSMGNVVAGEALRRASSQLVNTYVAMQGAVPAHCYDASTVNRSTYSTPDRYAHYWADSSSSYFSSSAGAGSYVNFYNTNDYALGWWNVDQGQKPDNGLGGIGINYPGYFYSTSSGFYKIAGTTHYLNFPTNTYEIFAYADPSWSYALGAQANVGGAFKTLTYQQVDLFAAPYNFGSAHKGHSAEFRSDNMSRAVFWNILFKKMFPQP